jgi:hypothetical protein
VTTGAEAEEEEAAVEEAVEVVMASIKMITTTEVVEEAEVVMVATTVEAIVMTSLKENIEEEAEVVSTNREVIEVATINRGRETIKMINNSNSDDHHSAMKHQMTGMVFVVATTHLV